LKYWTPESTLLAGEYLWMATEALSRGIVEADAAAQNITPSNLAKLRDVASPSILYKQVREQVIFDEDKQALDALSKASEGFEHGYMPIPDVRALADPILEIAARNVRHALISVLGMSEADTTALLDPDFDEPCGLTPPMKVLRGELRVTDPRLAPSELQSTVEMDWESKGERQIERNTAGKLTITATTTATLQGLPEGMGLTAISSGVRVQGATAYTIGDVIVQQGMLPGLDPP
jgi:hypothetical protein